MTQVLISNLAKDGEKRPFKANGYALVGSAGGASFTHATFEPGWRWSTDVAPIAGTTSCQTRHLGYVISGQMHVVTDDGTEVDVRAGDAFDLPSGHDAYVVGNEPCVMVDVSPQATTYARGGSPTPMAEDRYQALVRKGFNAFNTGDLTTLAAMFSKDVTQHVPGQGRFAGSHKGIDSVLDYYRQLAELTDGTVRAHLVDVHADGHAHANATYLLTATRNGVTRASRASILFTFLGDKITDLLEMRADIVGDDAFLA
jgi:ketosteroid isomerase-like protein